MKTESNKIKEIYSGSVAKYYDLPISHMFKKYKEKVFKESSLKSGDKVLVYCCGSGLDFSIIEKRIGSEGKIVGVDFSPEMLTIARERINKNGWTNVELIEADVTQFSQDKQVLFDAGVCTLGLSIIPEFKTAYYSLVSKVRKGGEVIIGDMQLASDKYARFNPFTISFAKRFGGSYEGHQNSLEIRAIMQNELMDVSMREFFLKSYYYCIGKKP